MMRNLGWIPQLPDQRDFLFKPKKVKLPRSVDLRKYCPKVYDQGSLGSCTAQAIAGAMEMLMLDGKADPNLASPFSPSRLFIYYYERVLIGTVNQDSGAYIRDGMKVVNKLGAPDESLWPHKISSFKTKPSDYVNTLAEKNKVDMYARVSQNLTALKSTLAQGLPVVFGFGVYESFENIGKNGKAVLPKKSESLLGGHAVVAVGYNKTHFICRNSWGDNWGDKGYFYMPYSYLTNPQLSSDFWTIKVL